MKGVGFVQGKELLSQRRQSVSIIEHELRKLSAPEA